MAILIVLATITFFSTMIGGIVAVKYRRVLPYFFAFASGSLISIAFFDILPESLSIASSIDLPVRTVLTVVVISYLIYSFLEKVLLTHHYDENDEHGHIMGPIGASSLVIHSFLDGVAIGTAYAVNPSVGLIVAFAVIFHDFTDGINTVTLMLKNKQKLLRTQLFLIMDALAPVVGVVFTSAVNIGEGALALPARLLRRGVPLHRRVAPPAGDPQAHLLEDDAVHGAWRPADIRAHFAHTVKSH